jgi:hypothetical protein
MPDATRGTRGTYVSFSSLAVDVVAVEHDDDDGACVDGCEEDDSGGNGKTCSAVAAAAVVGVPASLTK